MLTAKFVHAHTPQQFADLVREAFAEIGTTAYGVDVQYQYAIGDGYGAYTALITYWQDSGEEAE